jgi:hypothetical protein
MVSWVKRAYRLMVAGRTTLLAILALTLAHALIFAPSLRHAADGVLLRHIPFDFNDTYHRVAIFISDTLRSGQWPLWDPLIAGGTPFFINPQTSLWWPITWLVSYTVGYTHDVAQYQVLYTLLLGGVGCLFLARHLFGDLLAALAAAVCFTFSSAIFANLEHWDIINGVCHAPWIFWLAFATTTHPRRAFLALPVAVASLLVSSYPGVIIMISLWLMALATYLTFTTMNTWRARRAYLTQWGLAGALSVGLTTVHWLPILFYRAEFSRGSVLDVDTALASSLATSDLWGMFFPFLLRYPFPGQAVDISMRGLYVGVVALPLAVLGLSRSRVRHLPALAVFTLTAVLLFLGANNFFAYALHLWIPVLNFSRFPPGDNRGLFALGVSLFAAAGLALYRQDPSRHRGLLVGTYGALAIFFLVGMAGFRVALFSGMTDVEYAVVVLAGLTTQAALLGVAAVLFLHHTHARPPSRRALAAVLALLVLDVGNDVYVNYPLVGVPPDRGNQDVNQRHVRRSLLETVLQPRRAHAPGGPHIMSYRSYTDRTFTVNYAGAFVLNRYNRLQQLGFESWLADGPRVAAIPRDTQPSDATALRRMLQPVHFAIELYNVNAVVYTVHVPEDSRLVFNEVFFPGWRTYVDGVLTPTLEVGGGLRGCEVSAGRHEISTQFRPKILILAVMVATACFAFLFWRWWVGRAISSGFRER